MIGDSVVCSVSSQGPGFKLTHSAWGLTLLSLQGFCFCRFPRTPKDKCMLCFRNILVIATSKAMGSDMDNQQHNTAPSSLHAAVNACSRLSLDNQSFFLFQLLFIILVAALPSLCIMYALYHSHTGLECSVLLHIQVQPSMYLDVIAQHPEILAQREFCPEYLMCFFNLSCLNTSSPSLKSPNLNTFKITDTEVRRLSQSSDFINALGNGDREMKWNRGQSRNSTGANVYWLSSLVWWMLLWKWPKVQAMANTGKCLGERDRPEVTCPFTFTYLK